MIQGNKDHGQFEVRAIYQNENIFNKFLKVMPQSNPEMFKLECFSIGVV